MSTREYLNIYDVIWIVSPRCPCIEYRSIILKQSIQAHVSALGVSKVFIYTFCHVLYKFCHELLVPVRKNSGLIIQCRKNHLLVEI